ncbi:hypothetical protein [Lysinibacillus sp. G01H]|uniref:hypothetical protein n=1 Tax=Lysinibacillus sp. G01H TaxID=3026425 RepID=UPI00237E89C7|nr:hypothetical protein [Lysinibacillus sp. G01H]WDU80294.1 hypothetical protein PSR12_03835 [Lysinibacillus sp. G01H]
MTTLIEKYHKLIEDKEQNEHIGYYPVKIRPISEAAKMKFTKELTVENGEKRGEGRLFSFSEMTNAIKGFLTKEKLDNSPTFTRKLEIFFKEYEDEIENKRHYKSLLEISVSEDFKKRGWMIGGHEYSIEIGDFIEYEEKEKLTFSDLKDLRNELVK